MAESKFSIIFSDLTDPRIDRTKRHKLLDIIGLTITEVLCGADNWVEVEDYMGILANVFALGFYVPKIGIYILLFFVIFLLVWYIMITRSLFQLGRTFRKKSCNETNRERVERKATQHRLHQTACAL